MRIIFGKSGYRIPMDIDVGVMYCNLDAASVVPI